ncbi:ArsR/SmtB family transcription factor [Oceaniglobus trochenteri]|uniref:ArsR/SmtB family transcription factor n=1 Tax=Oceaniglobus trochenteri TaxID=2763260 RepID=UPI001CFF87BD|nr:metalloregulator ArsR/SmtB family transcription factor [Oceaniglobus trochenteri]
MDNNLNDIFSALADPTRRAVIERLTTGPAPVSELHLGHDMAMPSFLKHLGKLESAGLIHTAKAGRVRTVHLEAAPIARAVDWLTHHRTLWEGRLDRLSALAEHLEKEPKDG